MRGLRKPWSPEDDAVLTAMWTAGETGVAIGLALGGRGEEAVRDRAMRHLGLPRRPNRVPGKFLDGLPRSRRPRPAVKRPRSLKGLLVPFEAIRFVDRRYNQCAFIAGDAVGEATMCCGRPAVVGRSWCEGHLAMCTIPLGMSKLAKEIGA